MWFLLSDQWAQGWTVRRARLGSIGLLVEASSFSFHLGVLSRAGWRLSARDWRCHLPRHVLYGRGVAPYMEDKVVNGLSRDTRWYL
ncbi:UNVERIFIED_CONTAM: hypothetical protein Sradi_1779800 [Sesamum radiatum]|uniref:Uncharacterized protein n=1 Tax=Sesamum radiatum TaxID=300843 RepID=A0AAW2TVG1_SESRA